MRIGPLLTIVKTYILPRNDTPNPKSFLNIRSPGPDRNNESKKNVPSYSIKDTIIFGKEQSIFAEKVYFFGKKWYSFFKKSPIVFVKSSDLFIGKIMPLPAKELYLPIKGITVFEEKVRIFC